MATQTASDDFTIHWTTAATATAAGSVTIAGTATGISSTARTQTASDEFTISWTSATSQTGHDDFTIHYLAPSLHLYRWNGTAVVPVRRGKWNGTGIDWLTG